MTNSRHSGEVALVTGANKGIGWEIARRLAAEGVTVYLGARDEERGRRAARDLANAVSPGFVTTDLNGHRSHLTAGQGADLPVKFALLGVDGPTGTFLGHDDSSVEEVLPW